MENISKIYIGVDVSKEKLDIHIHPLGITSKIDNTNKEINKFIKILQKYNIGRIGCEATGGYEQLLQKLLKIKAYDLWVIDPRRIKGFKVAIGCKSKSDKVDAQNIAEFVAVNSPNYEIIHKTELQEKLQSIINRKHDLIKFLASEKARIRQPSHAFCQSSIEKFINIFTEEIDSLDQQIEVLLASEEELNLKADILASIPGIGKSTAALLVSFMPELGKLNKAKISALVGVCPYDNESGKYKGKKFVKGGRSIPRKALYMCALSAMRFELDLKKFYRRLREKNKPFKLALVAVMRKLIVLANSLLKKMKYYKANNSAVVA